jgi:hypothetical protein
VLSCYKYSTYCSALFSVLPPISGKPVGQHPIIVRLLKGIFNKNPPLPRYTATWNVGTVLTYLMKTLHPVGKLSLKLLTLKLNALLASISAKRAQTLVASDTAFMTIRLNKITLFLLLYLRHPDLIKPDYSLLFLLFLRLVHCVLI